MKTLIVLLAFSSLISAFNFNLEEMARRNMELQFHNKLPEELRQLDLLGAEEYREKNWNHILPMSCFEVCPDYRAKVYMTQPGVDCQAKYNPRFWDNSNMVHTHKYCTTKVQKNPTALLLALICEQTKPNMA